MPLIPHCITSIEIRTNDQTIAMKPVLLVSLDFNFLLRQPF